MNKLYFIKAPCHQSNRPQGFQFAPDEIKEKYDYEINPKLFDGSEIDTNRNIIKLCPGYNLLYNHISNHLESNPEDIIITIGGDNSISAGTIPAINERYIKKEDDQTFTSDLIVLWIDSFTDIKDFETSHAKNLNEMPIASILGLCDSHFTKHKLNVSQNQIIYFGLTNDEEIDFLVESDITFLTANKITQLNNADPEIIINILKDKIEDRPVHIVLDMKVFHKDIVKSVYYGDAIDNNNGLQINDIDRVLMTFKKNIVAMDITEFNPLIGNKNDVKVTKDLIRYVLQRTFDIKEKKINVFTEDSYFPIYRPLDQEDPETDIGWFILRGIKPDYKEELLELIPDDTIISLDIDDNTYLVTKTTMNEQNEKSYYVATTINDTALYPQEKAAMMFELVNK